MRTSSHKAALVALTLALVAACGTSAPDDNAVTAGDQNLDEVPCRPADQVVCHAGEHTISRVACAPGLARCIPDACELPTLVTCTSGYVLTTASCRSKTARCTAPDAGPSDAGNKG